MVKSRSEKIVDKKENEVLTYASKEEEDEFLNFSDSEMECSDDISENEEITENVPKACNLDMSDDEDCNDESGEEVVESDEEKGNEGEDDDIEEENDNGDDESVQAFDRKSSREQTKIYNERNSRTLFVGNITNKTSKKVLLQLFNSKKGAGEGAVETIRIRGAVTEDNSLNSNAKRRAVILNKFSNDNQVLCAFVVLKKKEDVDKCLKLNGHLVDGKHIRVDRVKGKKINFKENNCIFIGNLPYSVNEEIIRESFDKCGEIVNVRLVRNKTDGSIKGIGFIEFTEQFGVDFALKLAGNLKIENREIRIQKWSKNQTQAEKRKNQSDNKANFKRARVVAPTNMQGDELKEFILSKKRKMLKKAEKRKSFIKAKRNDKPKKQ